MSSALTTLLWRHQSDQLEHQLASIVRAPRPPWQREVSKPRRKKPSQIEHCSKMSNTNIVKCDACRKDFKSVWFPDKLCCRLAQNKDRILGNTYSRHMTQQRLAGGNEGLKTQRNNIAPFSSSGKPTCGHFFSRNTDHRKRKIGIPPSNLVQWRSYVSWPM